MTVNRPVHTYYGKASSEPTAPQLRNLRRSRSRISTRRVKKSSHKLLFKIWRNEGCFVLKGGPLRDIRLNQGLGFSGLQVQSVEGVTDAEF